MNKQDIIARLRENEAALKARGVVHAALFGSAARDEQSPDSDIDTTGARHMATIRKTLSEIRATKPKFNRTKLEASTDAVIARQIAEDADTASEISLDELIAPKNLRRRLGMTQEQFAEALGIPVATLRNWEQGRNSIDPAAKSLLILIARDPRGTLEVLAAARAA